MKPVHTLVFLANEQEARLLENDGIGKGLRQIQHLSRDEVSGKAIAYADTPGRSRGGPGGAQHGMEPPSSEIRQNRDRFAADLMTALDKTWAAGAYDRLLIAAPPKMLGALRERLPKPMADCLSGDVPKDLLRIPQADLPKHFKDLAAF